MFVGFDSLEALDEKSRRLRSAQESTVMLREWQGEFDGVIGAELEFKPLLVRAHAKARTPTRHLPEPGDKSFRGYYFLP